MFALKWDERSTERCLSELGGPQGALGTMQTERHLCLSEA